MGSRLQIQGDESILLRVTHSNIKSFSPDVRFSLLMTVEAVKEKLWKKCGTSVGSMSLELYDETGSKVSDLSDNFRPLGFYSPQDGYRLHVIDLDPSSVTSGTFRKFKEKLVQQNPTLDAKIQDNYMEDLCANIKVGDRCQIEPGEKRGVVKFVGQAETLAPGFWVGIQYDEPLGKHDGMVKGARYFDCPQLHGAMVRPDKVKVGDYPERDLFEEDEI
ncbi:CAP Gly-rich domain [Dillenia turbinata]|uniref:CAP Gly-rich domain n=1 Tax=Dillenia turbinata TaxID=194707 RepID=A0AAN8WAC5_9MAGN